VSDAFWDDRCPCGEGGFAYNSSAKRWWCKECWRREKPDVVGPYRGLTLEEIRENRMKAGLRP
jgi:hypothetical protein